MPTPNKPQRPWLKAKATTPPPTYAKTQARNGENQEVHGTNRWTRMSKRYREENPYCVKCLAEERFTPSECVDHIVPINMGGAKWDESNMMALCNRHHSQKSAREKHEYERRAKLG